MTNLAGETWTESVAWGVSIAWVYFSYKVMVKAFKTIAFACGKENKKILILSLKKLCYAKKV